MERLKPERIDLSSINNGLKYKKGDGVQATAINSAIQSSAYAQEVAQHALDLMKDTQVGTVTLGSYPIGSIYMSLEPTSPASLFGGTWEKIEERFLFASGDETLAGSIGGSKDATLVLHSHEVVAPYNLDGQPLPTAVYMGNYFGTATETGSWVVQVDKGTGYRSMGTVAKGESATNKNMPPYLAVYMWKRVA